MSNLIGDFAIGSTMVGGDPDAETSPWHAHIVGKTTFVSPKLSVAPRLSATIVGKTRFTATLGQGATRPALSGTIVGKTTITPTFHVVPRPALAATITGRTRFIAPFFSHGVQFDFLGSVAALRSRTMTASGEVLSEDGTVYPKPYVDEPQPVHFFV